MTPTSDKFCPSGQPLRTAFGLIKNKRNEAHTLKKIFIPRIHMGNSLLVKQVMISKKILSPIFHIFSTISDIDLVFFALYKRGIPFPIGLNFPKKFPEYVASLYLSSSRNTKSQTELAGNKNIFTTTLKPIGKRQVSRNLLQFT